jgi:ABC-type multidrug transport system ATPase subunit
LELISSRVTGNTTGEININGEPVSRGVMTKIAGYVKQKDILLASSTVREAIEFSAHLRLPTTVSKSERLERVETVIKKLGLTKCADTKVGDDATRGVSGGELKRTAIGVELVTQPNLLFLDEPTSGLDSSSAFTIVDILKNLAHEDGTTVVCTLHQPRSNIFYLFDRLILLHAGRVLYQGPPADAIPFFALCGHPCPAYTNPPDFFMDVITDTEIPTGESLDTSTSSSAGTSTPLIGDETPVSVPSPSKKRKKARRANVSSDLATEDGDSKAYEMESSASAAKPKEPLSVDEMVARWRKSKKSKRAVVFEEELRPIDVKRAKARKPGCFSQTVTLFDRAWKNNLRNPMILWAQLGQHIFLAIFIGLMYLRIGNKENSLTDRSAAIFFAMLNAAWIPALTAAFVFPAERPLFNRERAGGFYKVLPYYLATTLSDQPLQILFVVLNSAISYWMLALNPGFKQFVIYTVVVLLCLLASQSMALVMSALSPSADVANIVAGLVLMLFMAFGGFMLSTKNTPPYFYPFQYTSPFRYAYRALMQNDLNGITLKCSSTPGPCPVGNYTILTGPPDYNITGPLIEGSICNYPCTASTGSEALKQLGLDDSGILEDSMILLGMSVILRFIIWAVLEFVTVGGS